MKTPQCKKYPCNCHNGPQDINILIKRSDETVIKQQSKIIKRMVGMLDEERRHLEYMLNETDECICTASSVDGSEPEFICGFHERFNRIDQFLREINFGKNI